MSVEIDPVELGFRRPFTVEVSRILKIRNPNTTPVAFKVKTTAPKQYCVRPNSGRIEPDREVEVTVLLQAMKQDPPADAKCRDKFLVQSCPITGDKEFAPVQDIWDSVEKSQIQEKKIRVTFQPAEGNDNAGPTATPIRNNLSNGVEATPEPHSYASPSETDTTNTDPAPPAYSPSQRSAEPEEKKPILAAAPPVVSNAASAAAAAAISAKDATQKTLKDLPAKVDAAKSAAVSAVDNSGLRQRKSASTATANPAQVHPAVQGARQGSEGVPLHIVAILCLISFLLAYFFF